MKIQFSFLLFFFSIVLLFAQDKPVYAPPVRGPLLITGTFGELRSDHFHAGLDMRASTGTAVYAVADGYVSRLRVSAGGYGQAIYIDHPEGYRTVYGHLSEMKGAFIDTVRSRQYAEERFSLDLRFDSLAFPVKRGDRIGAVGNRGYSFGSHLHFEVRDIETDAALNPLDFGINVPDTRKPQLRKVKLYELDESTNAIRENIIDLNRERDGVYSLGADPIVVYSPVIGLGIKAYDRQNSMPNYNGIYEAALYRDSLLLHTFRYDSISFEETRYLNAHTDYADWKKNKSWFHRLFLLPNDKLGFYEVLAKNFPFAGKLTQGQIRLRPNEAQAVQIVVKDWTGNISTLNFDLLYQPGEVPPSGRPYQYFLPHNEASVIAINDLRLEFPEDALYTDCRFTYQRVNDESDELYSAVHHLGDPLVPVQKRLKLKIEPTRPIAPNLKAKIVVARCPDEADASPVSYGSAFNEAGEVAIVNIRSFGDYCLLADTVAPLIEPKNFRLKLRNQRRISFTITDNFATAGSARGLRYRATLNGEWIMMEYDLKKNEIYYDFPRPLATNQSYKLEIRVMDDRGNETVFRRDISG